MLKTTQTVKEEKKEFDLKEAFVLWKNVSKSGKEYLSGFVNSDETFRLIAYFNTDKKNPKEPDIRVYQSIKKEDGTYSKSEKEVASLWTNLDKKEKKYVTGSTDEHEKLVGWFGQENQEARPYLRVYYEKN